MWLKDDSLMVEDTRVAWACSGLWLCRDTVFVGDQGVFLNGLLSIPLSSGCSVVCYVRMHGDVRIDVLRYVCFSLSVLLSFIENTLCFFS